MWELIQQNKNRSLALFLIMGICLLVLGSVIGRAWGGEEGWAFGLSLALIIWVILSLVSYFSGSQIILAISQAQRVTPNVHPQLYNIVEEMKISAGLPALPKVYIIPDPAPNAFATGRSPENSSIVVTAGLLSRLNRDELQGVIAHETSHILNRDILYMTFAGVMLGSIVLLSQVFLRSLWFGGGRSRSSSKGGGQVQMIFMVAAIVFAILAPLMAQLLYFAISRKREYLADATAIRLTRYPEGLASALEKISSSDLKLASANKATAGLYIINPLAFHNRKLSGLSSTHPPTEERIRILRNISGGANYLQYQDAYSRVKGKGQLVTNVVPPSGIRDSAVIPLRAASASAEPVSEPQARRDLGDLMRVLDQYYFIPCTCGLKIKVPPDYKLSSINCPRCGRVWPVPAVRKHSETNVTMDGHLREPLIYQRKGQGWETFTCDCGDVKQISPLFKQKQFVCSKCGRTIKLE